MITLTKNFKYRKCSLLFQHLTYPLTRMPQVKKICIGALDCKIACRIFHGHFWRVELNKFAVLSCFGHKVTSCWVWGLPYMTSAKCSDFLIPFPQRHVKKSAEFVPFIPSSTHNGRHIWRPPIPENNAVSRAFFWEPNFINLLTWQDLHCSATKSLVVARYSHEQCSWKFVFACITRA